MEKIMSKTDTPNDHRPLADSELDAVSGGMLSFGSAATTGRAATAPQSNEGLMQMLQQLLRPPSGQAATG
jgi:hypothetical protein